MVKRRYTRCLGWASALPILFGSVVPFLLAADPALGTAVRSERPEITWVTQFATSANDEAVGVAVAGSGIFVTGYTSAAFPGEERHRRPDAFVRRYDEDGEVVWTDQFGSDVYDYAYAIAATDIAVYVAGGSNGSLDGRTDPREFDVFVRAYDLDGGVVWTRQFGGASDDYAFGVDADETGVYVVGYTRAKLPGARSFGRTDAFVVKLRLDGRLAWTRQNGTPGRDEALAVSVDDSGVYVAGRLGGVMPGTVAAGGSDAFVSRFTTGGREVWTERSGSTSDDTALGIALGRNSVFVVGTVGGPIPHERDPDGVDAFVRKYRPDGRPGWTDVFGTDGEDEATAVAVDHGTLAIVGSTDGVFPDETDAPGIDAFVRTCDPSGRRASILQVDGDGDDEVTGVAAGTTAFFIAGVTDGTIQGGTALGKEDAFLAMVAA